jgi:hypothetical protein
MMPAFNQTNPLSGQDTLSGPFNTHFKQEGAGSTYMVFMYI